MENSTLSICQLGYKPESVKKVSLIKHDKNISLPDEIPFYIQKTGSRLKRKKNLPKGWKGQFFRWPFHPGKGEIDDREINHMSETEKPLYKGILKKQYHFWGDIWQADFSDFTSPGIFQIETAYQISVPFEINQAIYQRVLFSYLNFIKAQRSGFDFPGVRKAQHLDDAVLDTNGKQITTTGGWYDAGDFRKWLALTQGNLEALTHIARSGIHEFQQQALDEIKWGNKFYHAMINKEGKVYEDVGGGNFKKGLSYDKDWWYENHPGCNADGGGNYITDNVPKSGDERKIRTRYNPLVQFQFAYYQSLVAEVFQGEYSEKCKNLAIRAWKYGNEQGHDNRTLFLSIQLLAGIALHNIQPGLVKKDNLQTLANQLLHRQNNDKKGISGYFTEQQNTDGFRSIAFSIYPALAVLRTAKLFQNQPAGKKYTEAIKKYIENYLFADAGKNPFELIPYGVYHKPEFAGYQKFRDAGKGKYIRTFIHPFNKQEIVHGTNSVIMSHAWLLSEAAKHIKADSYQKLAELQIHWGMGHNTDGLSLFKGIGYKHPVAFSTVHVQIPDLAYAGYIGTPEDMPYVENSNWTEWSTQEVWDVPLYFAASAASLLMNTT